MLVVVGLAAASLTWIRDPLLARATAVGSAYLVLALTEIVPPFVPTLLVLVITPLLLGPLGEQYRLAGVLTWPADPVLALFAGGFSLGVAARKHGVDGAVAATVLRLSRGRRRSLLALVLLGTAATSMWMSNVAAAAMMLTALRPIVRELPRRDRYRRAVLLAIAVGANLGGMATPIGTGPNAIAISAASERHSITFLGWMVFALPLVVGMLALAFAALTVRYRVGGSFEALPLARASESRGARAVVVLFFFAVAAWLSEPLHGVSAPLVALATATVLFASGLLSKEDLGALDWSTLGLIAGGVSLGRLIEHTGLFAHISQHIEWSAFSHLVWLGAFVFASATLSALMSNTATAALLIPLAMSVHPSASTAVLIAMASSFGMPFSISTPPNAMVYGEGGLTAGDLLWIGLPLMLVGCAAVTLTGTPVLRLLGVP